MQEVLRIKQEHPDDSQCIVNDRVKGRLKVTRAFGAGFLKQVCLNGFMFNLIIVSCMYAGCADSNLILLAFENL